MSLKNLCAFSLFFAFSLNAVECEDVVDTYFPISKIGSKYKVFVPTTDAQLDELHGIYLSDSDSMWASKDIWFGVQKIIYLDALSAVMSNDKNGIIDCVKRYSGFIKVTMNANYQDGFLNMLFPNSQICGGSISYPIRILRTTLSSMAYAHDMNTTVEYIKQNGGYMTIKLYDAILKNYGLYNDLLSRYEERTSSQFTAQTIDIEDLVNSLLKSK